MVEKKLEDRHTRITYIDSVVLSLRHAVLNRWDIWLTWLNRTEYIHISNQGAKQTEIMLISPAAIRSESLCSHRSLANQTVTWLLFQAWTLTEKYLLWAPYLLHTNICHDGERDGEAQRQSPNQRRREETAPVDRHDAETKQQKNSVHDANRNPDRTKHVLWCRSVSCVDEGACAHQSQRNSESTVPMRPLMRMYVHTSWLGSSKASKPV